MDIDRAIKEVRQIPEDALEERVMEMRTYLADHNDHLKVVARQMTDWCYDREMCNSLGIDYTQISDREMMRTALCAYYWKYVDKIER